MIHFSLITVIVWAFTLASLAAVIQHLRYLRRRILGRRAYIASGENGEGRKIATSLVRSEYSRAVINLAVFLFGVGIIFQFRPIGWILIIIPIVSLAASSFALEA